MRVADVIPSNTVSETGPIATFRIDTSADLEALESHWRAFEPTAIGHVFQSFDFVAAWSAHVGQARGIRPLIVTVRDKDGGVLALLPFGKHRTTGCTVVSWLGGEHADYHGGLYSEALLSALAGDQALALDLLKQILAAIGDHDLLHLTRQPETIGGFTTPFLSLLPSHRNANNAHATALVGNWEQYYRTKASKSWRRTDRKHARRLAELGDVHLRTADDPDKAWHLLDVLARQKRATLERRGVQDSFAPAGVRAFYRDLAARSLATGMVEISALSCGDDIASVNFGLIRGNRYYYVLTGYDLDRYADYSPGRQHMQWLMQRCFEQGLEIFDFTIGDEAYKDQWCEIETTLWDSVRANSLKGVLLARRYKLVESVKRTIKSNPEYWSRAVEVRKVLLRVRGQPTPGPGR